MLKSKSASRNVKDYNRLSKRKPKRKRDNARSRDSKRWSVIESMRSKRGSEDNKRKNLPS